jgi:SnoaL-like protein
MKMDGGTIRDDRQRDEHGFIGGLIRAWREHDLARLIDRFDEDVVISTPTGTLVGRPDAERHLAGIVATLPDLTGDVIRWIWHGDELETHMLYAATVGGRALTWRGIDRYRFVGGKVVEKIADYDHRMLRRRMLMSPEGWRQLLRARRVRRELNAERLAPIRVSQQERSA